MDFQYLVIEGVIGAGKTTLTKMLAERFNAQIILEQHEENPFLEDFYRDSKQYAFQTQLFFLLSRYRQQQEIPQRNLFHEMLISDYLFDKDKIFAYLTLESRELQLYEKILPLLERDIVKPDLVVYLKATTERLMENIRLRNRSYERNISVDYIQALNNAYNQFFMYYEKTPLQVINTTALDFVSNRKDFEYLLDLILNKKTK
ncbi:deoxynucleoside kinase [candidate division KSB1 bacterium]|nr:deoxynucleoside kinase [candidate division KSB1 bacterium]